MKKVVLGLMVMMVVFFGVKAYASGRSERNEKLKEQDKNAYYLELEERYTVVLRHTLESDGYINAGITVTSVIKAGTGRDYTVAIHHDSFEYLSDEEIATYEERLEQVQFPDEFCSIDVTIQG
jgi:uncharacterized protein YxeA